VRERERGRERGIGRERERERIFMSKKVNHRIRITFISFMCTCSLILVSDLFADPNINFAGLLFLYQMFLFVFDICFCP
jgi:hypothetical protein